MKFNTIKYRKISISESTKEPWEDDYADSYEDRYDKYGTYGRDFYDDAPEEIEEDDQKDNISYEIRKILSLYGIVGEVEFEEKYGLSIRIYLKKREKMSNIIKIMDTVINKVKKQILPQYESEVELYETTKGQPVLEFDFYLLSDSESPF